MNADQLNLKVRQLFNKMDLTNHNWFKEFNLNLQKFWTKYIILDYSKYKYLNIDPTKTTSLLRIKK